MPEQQPEAVTKEQIIAFVEGLPPDLRDKLVKTRDEQYALNLLDERIAALSIDGDAKRKEARGVFRAGKAKQFGAFAWAKSLAGAPVTHSLTIPQVIKVTLRPPTGEIEAQFRAWHKQLTAKEDTRLPLMQTEIVLLQWISSVQSLWITADGSEQAVQDVTSMPYGNRLNNLRKLSPQILVRIANEALDLESWLAVVLEDELGNS